MIKRPEQLAVPLSADITALRDRTLGELTLAHDYYSDTKIAWDITRNAIAAGHQFSVRNLITGTVTSQWELESKIRGYVAEQLTEATFQQFIASFRSRPTYRRP
ncbi:MAG: hypothetical protein L0211_08795 [Planctomycetaceae bacterium]|nr:hypothetical protein [Planctomycetaceae bacterium]